jgi:hypothetical protein
MKYLTNRTGWQFELAGRMFLEAGAALENGL